MVPGINLVSLESETIYDLVETIGAEYCQSKNINASRILGLIAVNNDLERDLRWYAYVNFLDIQGFSAKDFPSLENFTVTESIDFDLIASCLSGGCNEESISIFEEFLFRVRNGKNKGDAAH